jgi:hypothetical protein
MVKNFQDFPDNPPRGYGSHFSVRAISVRAMGMLRKHKSKPLRHLLYVEVAYKLHALLS